MSLGFATYVIERAARMGQVISGPAEIEYGFGWSPTVSIWLRNRRMHFYDDWSSGQGVVEVAIHVANAGPREPGSVAPNARRAALATREEAWVVAEAFLIRGCGLADLPARDWAQDGLDHDKFIPHPPDRPHPGNLAQLIDTMR